MNFSYIKKVLFDSKGNLIFFLITFILSFTFILIGLLNIYFVHQEKQEKEWLKVKSQDNLAAYQKYIETNPKYENQAIQEISKIKKDQINFDNAINTKTESALIEYLKNCKFAEVCNYEKNIIEIISQVEKIKQSFLINLEKNDLSKGSNGFALQDIANLKTILPQDEKNVVWALDVIKKYLALAKENQKNHNYSILLLNKAEELLNSLMEDLKKFKEKSHNSAQVYFMQKILVDEIYLLAKKESENNNFTKALRYIKKGLSQISDHKNLLILRKKIKEKVFYSNAFKEVLKIGTIKSIKNYIANCDNNCPDLKKAKQKIEKAEKIINGFEKNIKNNKIIYSRVFVAFKDIDNIKKLFPKDEIISKWDKQISTALILNIKTKISKKEYDSARKILKKVLKVYNKNRELREMYKTLVNKKPKNSYLVPPMVLIKSGSFTMGSNLKYSYPKHRVNLKSFKISKTEITFDQFKKYARTKRLKIISSGWGKDNRPVINISWRQAVSYTKWLSKNTNRKFRLPTEAEWEFVGKQSYPVISQTKTDKRMICRYANGADLSSSFPWRNTSCKDKYPNKTAPVKSFLANKLGVYDMQGNVWEWTLDCWHDNFNGAPSDNSPRDKPKNCNRKVIKGGAWNSSVVAMLPSYRLNAIKNLEYNYIGFRIVEDL